MSRHEITFRLITKDSKKVELDSETSVLVGNVTTSEAKSFIIGSLLSRKLSKNMLRTIAFVLMRTNPWLWDYLAKTREKLDDKGVE